MYTIRLVQGIALAHLTLFTLANPIPADKVPRAPVCANAPKVVAGT